MSGQRAGACAVGSWSRRNDVTPLPVLTPEVVVAALPAGGVWRSGRRERPRHGGAMVKPQYKGRSTINPSRASTNPGTSGDAGKALPGRAGPYRAGPGLTVPGRA